MEIDSNDALFNEMFADCRDRQGKIVTGGRVEQPDLHQIQDPDVQNCNDDSQTSRFVNLPNRFEILDDDDSDLQTTEAIERVETPTPATPPVVIRRSSRAKGPANPFVPGTANVPMMETQATPPHPSDFNLIFGPAALLNAEFLPDGNEAEMQKRCQMELEMAALMSGMEGGNADFAFISPEAEVIREHFHPIGLDEKDPKSQKEIDRMPPAKAKRFNMATQKEFQGMKSKKVIEYVRITDIPRSAKIYNCVVNWVTKTVLGVYVKTKCRICFGGHRYDKKFVDCFAPTVNFMSVLIMLCLSAMFGWFLGSLDYSQAYLNAEMDEECFLRSPPFLREYDENGVELVWKMLRVIYGHPKGSRLWAQCLHDKLTEQGYSQFVTDQCVYGKWHPTEWKFVFLLIHSDDVIVASNVECEMVAAKASLLEAFEGVDQGNLSSFCGVAVQIDGNRTSLSMKYYWESLVKKFGVCDEKNMPITEKLKREECPEVPDPVLKTKFLTIIGSIIYGFTHCRLDLAFPVGCLTRVMHSPSLGHMKQLMNLLKYLNKTKDWTLNFYRDPNLQYKSDFVFQGKVDSSHADCEETSESTGGWFFFLGKGQGAISAKSGRSGEVALSSTESETIWACGAAQQGAFIKQFLDETKLFKSVKFELLEDSMPMINAQKKNVSASKFRHMKVKFHYLRRLINDGWCKLIKIGTKEQTADLATKILPSSVIGKHSSDVLGL